jgi:hypothetical protein
MTIEKRGLNYREAMAYVGVKRRTFDEVWRPYLNPFRQGSSLIFDRQELDCVFDEFKRLHAEPPAEANVVHARVVVTGADRRACKTGPNGRREDAANVRGSGASMFEAAVAQALAARRKFRSR